MTNNAFTPCAHPECDRSPVNGWVLYRTKPKGEPSIFMCKVHAEEVITNRLKAGENK